MLEKTEYLSKIPIEDLIRIWNEYWSKVIFLSRYGIKIVGALGIAYFLGVQPDGIHHAIFAATFMGSMASIIIIALKKVGIGKSELKILARKSNLPEKKVIREYKKHWPKIKRMAYNATS